MNRVVNGEVAAENPFGIHFLKFFISLMILAVHGLIFVGLFKDFEFATGDTLSLRLLAMFPSSILVPFTAGATQGLLLSSQFQKGRLPNFPLGPFARILLFLALLESTKAMILGPGVFFGWNVVHMIAASLLIVVLLSRLSIHLVWISCILCLALTPVLRTAFVNWQVGSAQAAAELNETGLGLSILYLVFALTALYLMLRIWSLKSIKSVYKLRLTVLLACVTAAACAIAMNVSTSDFFTARLLNLPAGVLVGDRLGMHYWPLFPWYTSVAFGFLLYHVWNQVKQKRIFVSGVFAISIVTLFFYFRFYFAEVASELDPRNFWGHKLFAGSLALVAYGMSSFALFGLLCDQLARYAKSHQMALRNPALFRIPFVYSKTILWSYLFVNTFGIGIAWAFAKVFPTPMALVLCPVSLMVGWYWLGELVISLLAKNQLAIQFTPVPSAA